MDGYDSMVPQNIISSSEEEESSLRSFSSSSPQDSSDFVEDTASSSSSSSSSIGSIYELSTPKQHLPLKRGLSKYYQGKSQSYACFSDVRCLEDLAKPERQQPLKKLRTSKSCGEGMGRSRTISKKGTSSFSSTSSRRRRRNFSLGSKPPTVRVPTTPQAYQCHFLAKTKI